MAFPRRGTRSVDVDGVRYGWRCSGSPEFCEPAAVRLLARRAGSPGGSVLEVRVWRRHCPAVTPEVAASLVRGALARGWDPLGRGAFRLGPDEAACMFPPGSVSPEEQELSRRFRAGLG